MNLRSTGRLAAAFLAIGLTGCVGAVTEGANIARDNRRLCIELPRITGITGESLLIPAFRPRDLAKARNIRDRS